MYDELRHKTNKGDMLTRSLIFCQRKAQYDKITKRVSASNHAPSPDPYARADTEAFLLVCGESGLGDVRWRLVE